MKWAIVPVAIILFAGSSQARAAPPLKDPVTLNIGFVCQWQQRCMSQQKGAMKRSLKLVRKYQPATWRIQMCNRNAARSRYRVDWVGFEHCIRNTALRPEPVPARSIIIVKKRPKRISQSAPPKQGRLTQNASPPPSSSPPIGFGERG